MCIDACRDRTVSTSFGVDAIIYSRQHRASKFQVPESFLLQQAAWLYERHLEHVRTQMKKVGSANAPAASGSGSGNTAVGGVPMQRGGSHGSRCSSPYLFQAIYLT